LTAALDLAVPADPVLRRAHRPASGGPDLPRDDASDVGRRHRRPGRWIGPSGQIAADLLPELGDSRVIDDGEGR
jgi:hypothetical protein